MASATFSLIVACDRNGGMGLNGRLPWPKLKNDMAHFRELTLGSCIIMGRKTLQSLGRSLAGRLNIVVSNTLKAAETKSDLVIVPDFTTALRKAEGKTIFVIGGAELYASALQDSRCIRIELTQIFKLYPADTFFPIDSLKTSGFELTVEGTVVTSEACPYQFLTWQRSATEPLPGLTEVKVHQEYQYLDLVREILAAPVTPNRTGIPAHTKFGCSMRFDLEHEFPLLTTKITWFRGIAEELLWMLRGSTSAKELEAKGIKFWSKNASLDFLRKRGLDYKEGELGPVYGFQWRHFGATYVGPGNYRLGPLKPIFGESESEPPTWQGVDQISWIINKIKTSPTDRDLILTAWNPVDIPKMALPPCHMLAQFHVRGDYLDCKLSQRSADMGLGVPFNIASYSLLTYMLAYLTGLKPGIFTHDLGNTHVYVNQVDELKTQIQRVPYPWPKLEIVGAPKSIDDFSFANFELIGYKSHPKIEMDMAV